VASAFIVAAIFGFALPRFASYRSAWASMGAMTWQQALLVAAAAVGSMVFPWIVICPVLPSVRLREAAVVNLGSSAVANTLPAGGSPRNHSCSAEQEHQPRILRCGLRPTEYTAVKAASIDPLMFVPVCLPRSFWSP
jgi:hypothetical protein